MMSCTHGFKDGQHHFGNGLQSQIMCHDLFHELRQPTVAVSTALLLTSNDANDAFLVQADSV